MNLVDTTKGPLPREELEVKEIVTEDEQSRNVNVEWYHNGEMVRRDCLVCIKTGLNLGLTQQGI